MYVHGREPSLRVGGCRRLQADLPVFGGGGIPWVVSGGWLGPFVGGRCGDSSSSSRVSVPGRWPSFTTFGVFLSCGGWGWGRSVRG
jgi:hypothetical protein